MDVIPVDSSSARGIGYDEDRRVLYVQYVDGEVYEYFKVPRNDYIDLLNAKSIGWSVNKRIKPYYNFRKN
jgi:hypothetical protein